jgi:DNA-binding beta-propeller fold protein YncE
VADTGKGRLVVLDAAGHLVRAAHSGATALQQPFALVLAQGGMDVLDAAGAAIERFDSSGHFVREIVRDPALLDGRGLAVGPDGRLYVANPLTNSIVVLAADGKIERRMTSPLGAGPGQFNQPSDVAVGAGGTLYVLDNQNNRIEALTPAGSFVAQWPAPPSDTLHSVHLLPLPGGRLLASDPSGALLLYAPGGGSPIREPLHIAGQTLAHAQPLGLSLMPSGQVLVSDGYGGQLLVVPAPH